MGVLRWTSVCALLVLTAVSAGGIGCRNDKSDDDPVNKTGPLDVTHNKLPVDPGSPGLEPPNSTGNPVTPGTATGGSSAPVGMMMTGNDGPALPSAGTSGGNTSAPGAAAGSGSMPTTTVDAGAPVDAGTTDGGADDPCAQPTCGLDQPTCTAGLECVSLTRCSHAVCIETTAACQAACGTDTCAILESFPAQIACD